MSPADKDAENLPKADLPANLPEELIPVYDWYKQHGSNFLTTLSVVVILVAGSVYYMRHRDARNAEASEAAASATAVEELETLAGKYSRTKTGPSIGIKLAKAYFDAAKYAEALTTYDEFLRRHGRHELADIARLGRAESLEAQQQTDAALEAYEAFLSAQADHYLAPQATMGKARCLAIKGQKAAAKDVLERLMVTAANTPWEEQAKELIGVIDRFEGFKTRSIFDQLGAAAKQLESIPAVTNAVTPAPQP